jgi:hypothetical protein
MSQIASIALPPGPRLPAFVQAMLMLRHWPRFIAACGRRYGGVFTVRASMVPRRDVRDGGDAGRASRDSAPVELATTTAPGERQRVKHVILVPRGGGRIRVRAARQVPVTTQPAG